MTAATYSTIRVSSFCPFYAGALLTLETAVAGLTPAKLFIFNTIINIYSSIFTA
ncbi:MAG: hypothetical protein DID90_2727552602 [Candidatus Nitrotoga sp. LAW]|nr:MAG: hypothetical protein DID90_2727552602 [Candidatus Nitrotoga sp. LAW]